jgi:hypothetical protein
LAIFDFDTDRLDPRQLLLQFQPADAIARNLLERVDVYQGTVVFTLSFPL